MPSSASPFTTCQSELSVESSIWFASKILLVHCESAWRAIHCVSLANFKRGTHAGFCDGQSNV